MTIPRGVSIPPNPTCPGLHQNDYTFAKEIMEQELETPRKIEL